jgi:predicted Zn-dependent protease
MLLNAHCAGDAMKSLLLALAIATAMGGCTTTTSPTGRTQYVGAISQEQLNQLGAQAFAEAKAKTPQSTDARQTAYVRCVVNALVHELPAQWQATGWETAVFVDKEPNAFALPGGKVGVNTGIFTVARNQDQLATVIAHEIGHVVSRHHEERITRQAGAQGALQLVGALLGSRYGQGAANAAVQGGGILAQTGFLLPGSRAQESEADVVGQQLMAKAGFDPREAVNLWQNMINAGGNRPPEWLSTHPDPQSRLGELRDRASGLVPTYEQARTAGRKPHCG